MRTTLFLQRITLLAALAGSLAVPASGTVLHDFNNVPLVTTFNDTGLASGSTITVAGATGVDGNALQLNYNLTAGPFAGIRLGVQGYDLTALGATALRFHYRMTGPAQTMEVLLVDGDAPADTASDKIKVTLAPVVDGVWHSTTVPIASFTTSILDGNGSFNNREICQINLVVSRGAGADGTGSVYFDNIELVNGSTPVRTLETFSLPKADVVYLEWSQSAAVPFPLSLVTDETVPGSLPGNQVGRMDYTLSAISNYGGFLRVLNANLLAESELVFRYNGTGANADLEVKLVDTDDSVYVRRLADFTDTGSQWKTLAIPRTNFTLNGSGADGLLNLQRIKAIEFVMSRGEADAGVLLLDTLETVSPPAISKTGLGSVLTAVTIPDNPLSPNGDGRKDTFRVEVTLGEQAHLTLKVLSLQGVPLKTVDGGTQGAGAGVLVWDGREDDGRMSQNGLYFFILEAEGASGTKDVYKQVVGVVR